MEKVWIKNENIEKLIKSFEKSKLFLLIIWICQKFTVPLQSELK